MTCTAKHTKYQPQTPDEWVCPKCGSLGMVIEELDPKAAPDCEKIHELDVIQCPDCGHDGYGKHVTNLMMRIANLVTCPCCRGRGVVAKT